LRELSKRGFVGNPNSEEPGRLARLQQRIRKRRRRRGGTKPPRRSSTIRGHFHMLHPPPQLASIEVFSLRSRVLTGAAREPRASLIGGIVLPNIEAPILGEESCQPERAGKGGFVLHWKGGRREKSIEREHRSKVDKA
jgi:hypothetical protein